MFICTTNMEEYALLLFFIMCPVAVVPTLVFTNNPMDSTVCMGGNASMPCGFRNVTDLLTPSWNITMRLNNSSVVSNEISVNEINLDNDDGNANGLVYFTDTELGDNMSPDSRLVVGPVDIADDQSSYQCIFVVPGSDTFMSSTGTLTVIAPPMTAPNITGTTPLSSTSFTVNWTITDPNHSYIITWTNIRTGMMEGNMTVPENTNSDTVTRLNGIDNYNVSITANNSCGMSMMSDPSDPVYNAPITAPTNIIIPQDNITSESFVVQWDAVMDLFNVNYTVRWYRGDDEIGMASVDGLSYTVTELTPNTSYNVTVVAINTCCGAGPVNNVTMVMTNNESSTSGSESTMFSTATSLMIPTSLMTSTPGSESTMFSTATPTSLMTSTPGGRGPGAGGSGGSSNTGAIVGGVIGGVIAVIVVVIIIIVVYMCFCRHKDSTDGGDKQELKSPTGTGGSHTASVKPASNVPHQIAASGEEYAVTTRVTTTKPQQQPPTQEYAVVDKGKKHAAATQGIHYADLQDLPGSGSKPPTNQDPTLTYAMVA